MTECVSDAGRKTSSLAVLFPHCPGTALYLNRLAIRSKSQNEATRAILVIGIILNHLAIIKGLPDLLETHPESHFLGLQSVGLG